MSLTKNVSRVRLLVVGVCVLLVAIAVLRLPDAEKKTISVSADFADTNGIYVGNEVQYLGVPIGKVVSITPRGTVMTVNMKIDAKTSIPRDAAAEILQSALLTDRYVQLGPAYQGGDKLADGARIGSARTRSPISIDDVGKAIDNLVLALDRTGPGGKDIGDLIHGAARTFDGNGVAVRKLLISSREALADLNDKAPDLKALVRNLSVITRTLTARDSTIRSLTKNLAGASQVVAGQSGNLTRTLGSLEELTTAVSAFVAQNKDKLASNLSDVAAVAETIHQQQGALAEIFDLLPTGAENIARAFDPKRQGLRVQMVLRDTLIFSSLVRAQFCASVLGTACSFLFNADGTGALDLLINTVRDRFPGRFPWS